MNEKEMIYEYLINITELLEELKENISGIASIIQEEDEE